MPDFVIDSKVEKDLIPEWDKILGFYRNGSNHLPFFHFFVLSKVLRSLQSQGRIEHPREERNKNRSVDNGSRKKWTLLEEWFSFKLFWYSVNSLKIKISWRKNLTWFYLPTRGRMCMMKIFINHFIRTTWNEVPAWFSMKWVLLYKKTRARERERRKKRKNKRKEERQMSITFPALRVQNGGGDRPINKDIAELWGYM